MRKHELTDCSADVIALVSHAVQERLKTLVEKLGCIAEHRQEQFKVGGPPFWWKNISRRTNISFLQNNPNYVVYQDVKAQVQFLQELDRIEKKRHEEQEREVLIKAAKVGGSGGQSMFWGGCTDISLFFSFAESLKDGRPRSHCDQGESEGDAAPGDGGD